MQIQKRIIYIGILGAVQFLLLTALAMWIYPGGTIHERSLESYSFLTNYFSDLGRVRTFIGESNFYCHNIFKATLTISGICTMLFFSILPSIFQNKISKILASCAMVCGIIAGVCYIGIGWVAWDQSYWGHIFFVTRGFVAFLVMGIFYSLAILMDEIYPNKYAIVNFIFLCILFFQIYLMFYGARSWSSPEALWRQAVTQKVVVYSEIFVLLFQSFGILNILEKQKNPIL